MSEAFHARKYMIRRKVFTIFGAKFHIYDEEGNLIGYSKQKAFKLREDIRIYSDTTMSKEIAVIKARNIIDFSAAYDVVDSQKERKIGALRRKGWSSMFRDSWEFLDANDRPFGKIQEDSAGWALVRRLLCNLIPQHFHASANDGTKLADYRTHFNPFVYKLSVTIEPELDEVIDARMLLAGGILLAAIEGRQE